MCTRGSCVASSTFDMLDVRGMREMEYVECVCVWLGAGWEVRGWADWVWALPIRG